MSYLYSVEVWHEGLAKRRVLRASDKNTLDRMADAQLADWAAQYERKMAKIAADVDRETRRQNKEVGVQIAREETEKAQRLIHDVENILLYALQCDNRLNWDSLRDNREYSVPRPDEPEQEKIPQQPLKSNKEFIPPLNLFDKIFRKRAERKWNEYEDRFNLVLEQWKSKRDQIIENNENRMHEYELLLGEWEKNRQSYEEEREARNREVIDVHRARYLNSEKDAILEYCGLVLSRSEYPVEFSQDFDLDYDASAKRLIIEYNLPSPVQLPQIKEVKYVQTTDDFKDIEISEKDKNRLYDNTIYAMTLRTIHEVIEADVIGAIDAVVFNGWVTFIEKSSGAEKTACIVSMHVKRSDFIAINLERIDPRECFRSLKGIAAAKLHGLSPVAPVLQISREDARFVSSYPVAYTLNDTMNIAAMDWEDFEHLIRELFEKEFSNSGGEVKITQASRDRGVDAIAFDPDPVRGGKIVIQAKRYTNVVGVAAVRDLYGTVINEGAMKGILISTSTYGPDAYEFAKGKPITLLTGGNLLHMLEKFGYKAKIDLAEAKQIIAEEKRRDNVQK